MLITDLEPAINVLYPLLAKTITSDNFSDSMVLNFHGLCVKSGADPLKKIETILEE